MASSSSRSGPPPPLNLGASSSGSYTSQSGYFDSPTSLQGKRSSSYSSESSGPESPSGSIRRSTGGWVKPAPTVNVYTTCGRHTDQLLFGGPSLTELARAVLRKN